MFITKTSHITIAILNDREAYMESEELDKWFWAFMEENGATLSPHSSSIKRQWLILSTNERREVRTDVIRRVEACKKTEISYVDAVRGIFVEAENTKIRVQSNSNGSVENKL